VWAHVILPPSVKTATYWLALYATYMNWLVTTLAAVFGTGALSPITAPGYKGQPWQESFVTIGFMSVGLAYVAFSVILLWGLRARAVTE
jgi:hydroxylaminobenzene mutase